MFKSYIDAHTVRVEDFSNSLSPMDRISRQKNKCSNTGDNSYYKPKNSNKYLQNASSKYKIVKFLLNAS